jgi:isoleucyl-tRNA synthetase
MVRPVTDSPRHALLPRREVAPRQELPALELDVLARWRERDVFQRSLELREGAKQWVFYEGPPTANGPPGSARGERPLGPGRSLARDRRVPR